MPEKIKRVRLRETVKDIQFRYQRNINFLEKPLFIPSRNAVSEDEYSDGTGYEITCPGGLPVSYDIDVLNYLIHTAQLTQKMEIEFKSMRDLLQKLGYSEGKPIYETVERSLDKWSRTTVSFKNRTFYVKGGKYISLRNIHILSWDKSSSNRVLVRIDADFFNHNWESYAQVFQIKLMTRLKPYSKRVFELLKKNDRNLDGFRPYRIGFDKLMLKIPLLTKIPTAKMLWSWKKSIEEINELMPRFEMKYQYRIVRDPKNNANIMIRKVPDKVRISENAIRIPIDEVRSWVNDSEGYIVDDETFFRILRDRIG